MKNFLEQVDLLTCLNDIFMWFELGIYKDCSKSLNEHPSDKRSFSVHQ